jgi:beta-galactosidase
MELPGGSASSFPPMLSEDLLACYMVNTAMGMKGLNYYIFTGGPNYGDTGGTADIYDFGAFVRADGSINSTYYAAQRFGRFLDTHRWLQSAERKVSVRVACEQEYYRCRQYEHRTAVSQEDARSFMKKGVLYGLMASEYTPELFDTARGVPGTDMPLILCGSDVLSESSQRNIVSFLKAGGRLLAMQTLPSMNEKLMPCTILKDFIGLQTEPYAYEGPVTCGFMTERVYSLDHRNAVIPDKDLDTVIAVSDRPAAVRRKAGSGEVLYAGFGFTLSQYSQLDMLRGFADMLGAAPSVYHSSSHIFTVLLKHPDGRGILFAMNLYSSSQRTDIGAEGRVWKDLELAPMEVRTLEI